MNSTGHSRDTGSMAARGKRRRTGRQRLFRAALAGSLTVVALGIGLTSVGGCSRAKYRSKVNNEAYYLIDEKIAHSGEATAPYRIEVNPQSRFFDPFNPDRPPMPEDDPVSNRYMKMVDNKRGYPLWEANGRTNTAENPEWWTHLPLDERGVLVLNLDEAVRMSLLHSPTYQQNLETLFLSALDVSSERFLLDSQFFGGYSTFATTDGPRRGNPSTPNSSSTVSGSLFSNGSRPIAMRRKFATGTDLIVGLANSMTWQVAGPNTQSANTILDFSLVQPLLRQAGRDVVLERLTLAERTLLANVRAMERYRRGFYLQVVTGRQAEQGPQRRGGVFGGSGFQGFNALGGGFGRVGGGTQQGGFTDTGTPGAGGYLGLLQQQLQIENIEENVARLRENLFRLEDTYRELLQTIPPTQDTIPQQQLQVAQARQALFSSQNNLLTQQAQYEQQLDTFKRLMGLPPYLCVEIRDPLISKFKLISPELKQRRNSLADMRDEIGRTNTSILNLSKLEKDPNTGLSYRVIEPSEPLLRELSTLDHSIDSLAGIQKIVIPSDISAVEEDIAKLRSVVPDRRRQLARLRDIAEREKGMVCRLLPLPQFDLSLLSSEEVESLPDQLTQELQKLADRFQVNNGKLDQLKASLQSAIAGLDQPVKSDERFKTLSQSTLLAAQDLIAAVSEDILALQLIQARARTETALLGDVDIEPRDAVEIARRTRQDWLNNRAALVNSWRAVEVVGDDLESTLDIVFSGDMQNVGDNPLALRSATGRLRAGLQWDAPITRFQERNNYSQSLIEYQQAKRTYYQFEDTVWNSLRTTLRTIRLNQYNFELQRYAVRIAAQQISVNEDRRQILESLGQASGPTAARDAVSALSDLLNAQNLFIGVWVNYEALRRNLDLDMGTMQLDGEGLWIDPGPIRADLLGGNFGPAVMNYGLSESDMRLQEQMNAMPIEDMPLEMRPTQSPNVPPAQPAPIQPPQGANAPGANMQGPGGVIPSVPSNVAAHSPFSLPSAVMTPGKSAVSGASFAKPPKSPPAELAPPRAK
ncbi:MAG: hypothetical protein U0892_08430 [Pirellulales bacterium]